MQSVVYIDVLLIFFMYAEVLHVHMSDKTGQFYKRIIGTPLLVEETFIFIFRPLTTS